MVGIVIVSHSKALADSLALMAKQVSEKEVPIAAAGGIDDDENPFGTDAMKILEAIQNVYSEDGVIVFMDLGSAILSTEMALDFLDEDQKENIRLSAAPIVEGVASAVIQSGAGLSLDEVLIESNSALLPKQSQLGEPDESDKKPDWEIQNNNTYSEKATFTLLNTLGIHARPAAKIVGILSGFNAQMRIRNLDKKGDFVNGKSLNSLIMLDARRGDKIEIEINGPQAKKALEKLTQLFENHFGESTEPATSDDKKKPQEKSNRTDEESDLKGQVISGGIAIGPALKFKSELPDISKREADNPDYEIKRLEIAIGRAKNQIQELIEGHRAKLSEDEIGIFEAQIVLLDDPELVESARSNIRETASTAEYGWRQTVAGHLEKLEATVSKEIRARGNDLLDVGIRVLRILSGGSLTLFQADEPSILLADQLNPSDITSIQTEHILAICTEKGTETSHSAILSRNLGIPVIFGLGEQLLDIPDGKTIAVDAENGVVLKNPSDQELRELKKRQSRWLKRKKDADEMKHKPVLLSDGEQVTVLANISTLEDAERAVESGAEGSGLFRTEFLYMNRSEPPAEQEQFEIYSSVAETFGNKGVALRTADIGGDKPVPYLGIEKEANPFLGWRGIRYSLDEKTLFRTQIKAVLRASEFGVLSIMLPMISTAAEIVQAKQIISECKEQLTQQNVEYNPNIKIGVMIEVPAAVIDLEKILQHVDFISIGTNDLSQYLMAADRNNSRVSELGSGYQPAVLKAVAQIIETANRHTVPVSICGEMAGDRALTSLLLAMGLRRFSITTAEIPLFKHHLRQIDLSKTKKLLQTVLACNDAAEVKKALKKLE